MSRYSEAVTLGVLTEAEAARAQLADEAVAMLRTLGADVLCSGYAALAMHGPTMATTTTTTTTTRAMALVDAQTAIARARRATTTTWHAPRIASTTRTV